VNDYQRHGLLHAKLVLSQVARGRVLCIDTREAAAVPGVVRIFTADDVPAHPYNSHKWIEGMEVFKDETLFTRQARFHGDRIAAVVAESRDAAEAAARLVQVEYQEETPVLDPEAALEAGLAGGGAQPPLLYRKHLQAGDPDAALAGAWRVLEDRIETPKVHHAAMETHCCLAETGPDGMVTVHTPCQVIFQVQLIVAEALGIPVSRVRVIRSAIGGSFGGKGQPILEPVAAFLSLTLGRPVKLLLDRTDCILSTRTRHRTLSTIRTAVDRDGRILARDIHTLVDTGAYCTNGEAIAMAMGKKTFKLYRIPDQRYRSDVVTTNTPVGGACRGYGSPQICTATELAVDHAAAELGMDPLELRLRNLVHPHDRDPQSGTDLGNARVIDCARKGAELIGWAEKYPRARSTGRFARGVGMACAAHGNGYQGAYPDFIGVDLRLDSAGCAVLKGAFHDLGCGTVTTMQQIAAEVLALDVARIQVPPADTLVSPFDSAGTQASRVTFVCGGAVKQAAEQLRAQILDCAAALLGRERDDLECRDGAVLSRTDPGLRAGYPDLATYAQKQQHRSLAVHLTYESPGNPTSYAAHFAEVEVDRLTGRVRVLDFAAVHDIGRAINPGFAHGQIHGAVQMGIGMALSEEVALDARGRVSANRLSRYTLPNAPEMPRIQVALVEAGEDLGPFGAKSLGEIATVPVAAAVINAENHALGTRISRLPALPERIVAAIQGL
jgi:xanthine dehydrogenase molybdenum-binding subunit